MPPTSLPLPTLLSQTLVAFTIEFDNEAEYQLPHTTTNHGRTPDAPYAPWLVSLAMYANCLQWVPEEGVRLRDLLRQARTPTNLNGMIRWRHITFAPDPADTRPKPPKSDWLVHPTPGGRLVQRVCGALFATIESRWRERYGTDQIANLRESLCALVNQLDPQLPDCMPILGYGLFSRREEPPSLKSPRKPSRNLSSRIDEPSSTEPHTNSAALSVDLAAKPNLAELPLSALLSRPLLAFAHDFERDFPLSLAICANPLRVLNDSGVRPRDLPLLTGVSKESLAMAMGILRKAALVIIATASSAKREKLIRLTVKGQAAQAAYRDRVAAMETEWQARFGKATIAHLRVVLEALVGDATPHSPIFRALEPYPDGWRASVPRPSTLPHFPMVLHRGAFPDGS